MPDISIRSTIVLSILCCISIALLVVVELTKKEQKQPNYEEKMDAAILMDDCISYLKNTHYKDEVSIDNINDPNDTRIIGQRYSSITSGRGSLPVKLSTINPNFAALIIEMFEDIKLKKGDHIAIGATGSFPALNIAVCSAAEIMGLEVSFISSVTSSSWGANDPDYTYLDIHSSLIQGHKISASIIASSIGANEDIGRSISPEGRSQARDAIQRNGIEIIDGNSLKDNISKRLEILNRRERETGKKIKLYINIGGGIASLGSTNNSENLPSGLLKDIKLNRFVDKQGIMFEMAFRKIPIINLRNIEVLLNRYNLPKDPVPLPDPGDGELFYKIKYDLNYVYSATSILIVLILGIIVFDRRQNSLGKVMIQTEYLK